MVSRVAKVGSLSVNAKMATKFSSGALFLYFRNRYVVFARNFKFANSIQYNMQYIPCNNEILAQETLFCPKKHFLAPSLPKSA